MIRSYFPTGPGLDKTEGPDPDALWIDLSKPTDAERHTVSDLIGQTLPSLEDQEEIEHSSRLFIDDGVPVMTALLPLRTDAGAVETAPVTFILGQRTLVTVRHRPHGAFRSFPDHAGRATLGVESATHVLVGLLEAVVDRLADFTEQTGRDIEAMTHAALAARGRQQRGNHEATLRDIALQDGVVMQLRESLLSLERLLSFLQPTLGADKGADALRRAVKTCQRDVRTIAEQASFLSQKTALLLDATLGMIDIEQNDIAKIFSIVATVFLPPTLIASVFGMNFEVMPILEWRWGYPVMLALMVVSAITPLVWFRRRGWL